MVYAVTSIIILSASPREVHLDLAMKVFGSLNKYTKRGYSINPQPLNIDMDYYMVELKMYFGDHY